MMALLSMQDGLVTLIALGAGAVLLRRVLGFAKSTSDSACAHCSSAPVRPSAAAQGDGPSTSVFPLTLVRSADSAHRAASVANSPDRTCHS